MEKYITIGVAGHVDHGKTSLVKALTGIDTDRLQEEKRRGLSIEAGVALYQDEPSLQIAFMDVPGHTEFLKNTIRGLSAVDLAILVVAADDGVMPQTREHLEVLTFMGIQGGFVVLTKCDLVDQETVQLAEMELQELMDGTFLRGKPIVPFSAVDLRGIDRIRACISEEIRYAPARDNGSPLRIWIDQIKGFSGVGTVASGTVLSGKLRQDDPLVLLPPGLETRARSIQAHHRKVSVAHAGQRVGINLHNIPLNKIDRGMALAAQGQVTPSALLNARLKLIPSISQPVKDRQKVKLYLGTAVTNARAVLMEQPLLAPGEEGLVQFRLTKPIPAAPGDLFVIGLMNVHTVLGGGRILGIAKDKFRAGKAAFTTACLRAVIEGRIEDLIDLLLDANPGIPVVPDRLARDTGLSPQEIRRAFEARVKAGDLLLLDGGAMRKDVFRRLKTKVMETVEAVLDEDALKETWSPEEIRLRVSPPVDEVPFQRMIAELVSEGKLIRVQGRIKPASADSKISEKQEKLMALCLDYGKQSGLFPFSADTIWKLHQKRHDKREIQRVMKYLHYQRRLVLLNDERFLTSEAAEEIKRRVTDVILRKGEFLIADLKDALGYGRSVGIPVLEYLDTVGVTRRDGNRRVLMKQTLKEDGDERGLQRDVEVAGAGSDGP